jgi:hypothetical protein
MVAADVSAPMTDVDIASHRAISARDRIIAARTAGGADWLPRAHHVR